MWSKLMREEKVCCFWAYSQIEFFVLLFSVVFLDIFFSCDVDLRQVISEEKSLQFMHDCYVTICDGDTIILSLSITVISVKS